MSSNSESSQNLENPASNEDPGSSSVEPSDSEPTLFDDSKFLDRLQSFIEQFPSDGRTLCNGCKPDLLADVGECVEELKNFLAKDRGLLQNWIQRGENFQGSFMNENVT